MSAMAEKYRAKAKSKAKSLVSADPHTKVDASGWTPPEAMHTEAQTGPRPVSRRQFKRGGMVAHHAGRKPRAAGGMTASGYLNRDVKAANEDREGVKHVGGMKKGGRAHKMIGGGLIGRPELQRKAIMAGINAPTSVSGSRPIRSRGMMLRRADGGKVEHAKGCSCSKCMGGSVGKKGGGSVTDGTLEGTRPAGGRLARKGGGRAKKGMNVNIIIAPAQSKPAMMPPPGVTSPPPGGGPVGLHQGVPPPAAPAPMGPPPSMAMPRKRGGRAYPIDAGAGSGLGRLEKAQRAARA